MTEVDANPLHVKWSGNVMHFSCWIVKAVAFSDVDQPNIKVILLGLPVLVDVHGRWQIEWLISGQDPVPKLEE